jgi:arsenate reductase
MSTPFNVLFICTHNSARSIMAEAILNQMGAGRFRAYSAGSRPSGQVHPLAIELLLRHRMEARELRSKDWAEFSAPDSPDMHFVLTVCDQAAGETCPVWPGQPMTAHWGVEDPSLVQGTPQEQAVAFFNAFMILQRRIAIFLNLPIDTLDRLSLQGELRRIGQVRQHFPAPASDSAG